MEKRDYDKLYGEYKLFLRFATHYNCLEIDQLSNAEKDMYSSHIINMFQKMNVDELIYIYSKYAAFQENFNKLVEKYRQSLDSMSSKMNNEAYIKFMREGFHTLTEKEKECYPRSQYYINDAIARELNFNRGMSSQEIKYIESMVNGMAEQLKRAIDNKLNLISIEQINELKVRKDDLVRETMMIVGNLGKDFDSSSNYNKSNKQLKVYEEYLKKIELIKNNSNQEQLKTVSSNGEEKRISVSENEYMENGTHYHKPEFDKETHIQLK